MSLMYGDDGKGPPSTTNTKGFIPARRATQICWP